MRRTTLILIMLNVMFVALASSNITREMYLPSQNVVAEFMEVEDLSEGSRGESLFWNFSTATITDNNARFLDILTGSFISRDALAGSYPHLSPYANCANNPLIYIDPTGNVVIFINGFCFDISEAGNSSYWEGTDTYIMNRLGDNNAIYRDGSCSSWLYTSSFLPQKREKLGYSLGKFEANSIFSNITDENGNITEIIKVVTHSMGAAYGKGYVSALTEYMNENNIPLSTIEFEADFAPFQPEYQKAVEVVKTFQFSHDNDNTAKSKPIKNAIYNSSRAKDDAHSITSFYPDFDKIPVSNNIYITNPLENE